MTKIKLDANPTIKLVSDDDSDIGIQESRRVSANLHRRNENRAETFCCAFTPDQKLLAWTIGDGFVKVINCSQQVSANIHNDNGVAQDSEHLRPQIDCGAKKVMVMKFAPIGHDTNFNAKHILATGLEGGRIKLWNPHTGEMLYNLMDHTSDVKGLTFAYSGEPLLISCSLDKTLKVWDLDDDGNMTLTMNGHPLGVHDCAYSPVDPKLICSVGKAKWAVIWKLHHKRRSTIHLQLRGHTNDVVSVSWSPDGALVATASHDTTVILWDPYLGYQIMVLGHVNPPPEPIYAGGANGSWVECVSFSPDGSKVSTTCEDERLRVWPLWTNQQPFQSRTLSKPGSVCAYSPSGSSVALGNLDASVSVMDVPTSVMPLRHLSRMAARRVFDSQQIQSMTLPPSIRRYLMYTDSRH